MTAKPIKKIRSLRALLSLPRETPVYIAEYGVTGVFMEQRTASCNGSSVRFSHIVGREEGKPVHFEVYADPAQVARRCPRGYSIVYLAENGESAKEVESILNKAGM